MMQTEQEFREQAQPVADELADLFVQIKEKQADLEEIASTFRTAVEDNTIQGEVTVNSRRVLRKTRRFGISIARACDAGGDACEEADMNEGK